MRLSAFLVVFGCLFVGQLVISLTGLPLPASIIGLLVLFGLLQLGIVKLDSVRWLALVMLEYLAFLIVPACISLMQYFEIIRLELWQILVATVVSTLLVIIATGHSYQLVRALQKRHKAKTKQDQGVGHG